MIFHQTSGIQKRTSLKLPTHGKLSHHGKNRRPQNKTYFGRSTVPSGRLTVNIAPEKLHRKVVFQPSFFSDFGRVPLYWETASPPKKAWKPWQFILHNDLFGDTVAGRNPAPLDRQFILLFLHPRWFRDCFHQQYVTVISSVTRFTYFLGSRKPPTQRS